MHCRMFGGQAQPGKMAAVLRVVAEQVEKVKTTPGFLFVQVLHNGDEMVAVSSWRTEHDLSVYMHSPLAKETLARLAPLLVGAPTIKSFAISLAQEGEDQLSAVGGNATVLHSLQSDMKKNKPMVTKREKRARLARRARRRAVQPVRTEGPLSPVAPT